MINEEEKPKYDNIHAEPHFYWTKELVAEFAREVALKYSSSEIWSGNLQAEKQMVDVFIKRKKYEKIYNELIISDAGQTLIVDRKKLDELVKFLYNYRDAD